MGEELWLSQKLFGFGQFICDSMGVEHGTK